MWMATKDQAIVIPPSSYKLTMSTTDHSIVLSVRNLTLMFSLVWKNVSIIPQLRLYLLASWVLFRK